MDSNIYKGSLETIVLELLSKHEEMYGYQITKSVKELSGGEIEIKEGSLYPLLHRMESKGLITSKLKNVGNRDRKYYCLSEEGKLERIRLVKEMTGFLNIMNHIIQPKFT